MQVVSTIKWTELLKYTCFHVIPYMHFTVMGLFLQISMGTMITFPDWSLIINNTNWLEQAQCLVKQDLPLFKYMYLEQERRLKKQT